MALFNAAEILRDDAEDKQIICDFLIMPDNGEYPTITVSVSNKTRALYQQATDRHNNIRIRYRKGDEPEGVIINEPIQFCHEVLNDAYVKSEGLFDTDSKQAMLALLKKQPGFAKRLAGKLFEVFDGAELFDDDAKKN